MKNILKKPEPVKQETILEYTEKHIETRKPEKTPKPKPDVKAEYELKKAMYEYFEKEKNK